MSFVVRQLADVTECPICQDVFSDPRSLPCVHTFCFHCIEQYVHDKYPGQSVDCPMCRKPFQIPTKGVGSLPVNFFLNKLLNVRKQHLKSNGGGVNEVSCDVCSTTGATSANACASLKCVQCRENLCDLCVDYHHRMKATQSHQLVGINEKCPDESEDGPGPQHPVWCPDHRGKELDVYCRDCNKLMCHKCYFGAHQSKSHTVVDIETAAERFRKELNGAAERLKSHISDIEIRLAKVTDRKKLYTVDVDLVNKQIADR